MKALPMQSLKIILIQNSNIDFIEVLKLNIRQIPDSIAEFQKATYQGNIYLLTLNEHPADVVQISCRLVLGDWIFSRSITTDLVWSDNWLQTITKWENRCFQPSRLLDGLWRKNKVQWRRSDPIIIRYLIGNKKKSDAPLYSLVLILARHYWS